MKYLHSSAGLIEIHLEQAARANGQCMIEACTAEAGEAEGANGMALPGPNFETPPKLCIRQECA